MKGEVAPLHRKALLNALKTAAGLDPERLDELLRATQKTFVQLGWNTGEDLWTIGPLLEIAGRMARHEDQVDTKLPLLAKQLAQRQMVSPDLLGADVEREESLTLSLLAMSARMERMVDRETFGLEPDECRQWITEMTLESAAHLYAELELQDAAASERADVGAEGKQMVLQAAVRESLNILEPAWFREASRVDAQRRAGTLEDLRSWLDSDPYAGSRSAIVVSLGDGVDDLIYRLKDVRTQITALRERLRNGLPLAEDIVEQPSGHGPDRVEHPVAAAPAVYVATTPASGTPAPLFQDTVIPQRRRFGKRR